eukprot:CAMPEP_0182418218 /NCGR_PEP_ID=MMETSP1167-20130531/2706_1 /TAXON_ID=2988 /ORGANISM="Mallomonas Sp, Strain CCMP3275" /LENGTH=92 /DNA_ID=CAMNT_0024592331 /DNA_START=465 /DNA_END=743 /DNA_ORIENTATION=+
MGKTGQLFGGVTKKNLLELLEQKLSVDHDPKVHKLLITEIKACTIDESSGKLICKSDKSSENEIKKAGIYDIDIKLHQNLSASFKIEVISDK